jgi:hypothetical protein
MRRRIANDDAPSQFERLRSSAPVRRDRLTSAKAPRPSARTKWYWFTSVITSASFRSTSAWSVSMTLLDCRRTGAGGFSGSEGVGAGAGAATSSVIPILALLPNILRSCWNNQTQQQR